MKKCCLCDIVMTSEAQLEDHIHERHSYIFLNGFQALSKEENSKIMKENTPSLDSNISQLKVKSSHFDFKSSLLDLKRTDCDIQTADIHKIRDYQIKQHFSTYLKNKGEKNGQLIEPEKPMPEQFSNSQTGVCLVCNKEFMNKEISNHIYTEHTLKGTTRCPISDEPSLDLHKLKVQSKKKFQCEYCPTFFNRKNRLTAHIRSWHSSENKMTCKICLKNLSWAAFNEKYTETINGKKAFICKKCAKIEANLDQIKPDRFLCLICKRDYTDVYLLNQHHYNTHIQNQRSQEYLRSKMWPGSELKSEERPNTG